jgi:DNA-binding NarL/FixJ family response regulator
MLMPGGMTGFDLASKLREERPELKVIICSGYSAESLNSSPIQAAKIIRLQKPYKIDDLAKTIRLALAGRRGA